MISKVTMLDMLHQLSSGIAIDAAPNHTGIVTWDGEKTEEFYFKVPVTDKSDKFWLYKLRRNFKAELKKIVEGKEFEYCIIEDCYGGENYTTGIELSQINTVIDELIMDGVCFVDNFYRMKPSAWLAKARTIYKQRGKLRSKIETQGILEFLECEYYMKNKDLPEKDREAKKLGVLSKEAICFEDVCDAYGMLLAVAAMKTFEINSLKSSGLRLSDIKMEYVEELIDFDFSSDRRIKSEGYIEVELDTRNLAESIRCTAQMYPSDVLCAIVPPSKLGAFGMEHGFRYFNSNEGYLAFYNKKRVV